MLVSKETIRKTYHVAHWFSRRSGLGEPISRDAYYNEHASELTSGVFTAIGNEEEDLWELEQFNGYNWIVVIPDDTYRLVITNEGLKAVTNVLQGGLRLTFSGIKIRDKVIEDPDVPITQWTEGNFVGSTYGNVVYSAGTIGAKHTSDTLKEILRWRYDSSSGGLQYILTLEDDVLSDQNEPDWDVGNIALYIKGQDGSSDVLFGVASLKNIVRKVGTDLGVVGNKLKFYFNTVLSNIGYVSNLTVLEENESSLPEVPTENVLLYPENIDKRPYNCYLIDNFYGTNTPALAVPRFEQVGATYASDWVYFQPTDHMIQNVPSESFASDALNFMAVYWDSSDQKYHAAEGLSSKSPVGIRVNSNIVFYGEITNTTTAYAYNITVVTGGENYAVDDELNLSANDGLTLKFKVVRVGSRGNIDQVKLIGPLTGNIELASNPMVLKPWYDSRSQLPRNGFEAKIQLSATRLDGYNWNFNSSMINKPIYCGVGDEAGMFTTTQTECMIGWCTGANSIRLSLDLRNEATTSDYGTVKLATNTIVQKSADYVQEANKTAVTPKTLSNNYLQITKPSNNAPGAKLTNPINVKSFVRFNEILLGKGSNYPNVASNPDINDSSISFYGTAYRSFHQDLAEYYEADAYYEPGTLITIGKGDKEITLAISECNGVISSNPGYEMGDKKSKRHLPVALIGRVPVMFDGHCMPCFGDKVYLSKIRPGYASTIENGKCIGKIVQKSIGADRLIECSVRIDF